LITKPIIIVGAPRSGSTLLFQALSTHPDLWSVYNEASFIMSSHFSRFMTTSHFVAADQVDDTTLASVERQYFEESANLERTALLRTLSRSVPLDSRNYLSRGLRPLARRKKRPPIRLVDKTLGYTSFLLQPLAKVFPDAQYVFLVRDPRGCIASMYHAWREESSRFGHLSIPDDFAIRDYEGLWCFAVPPGWEKLNGASLFEICVYQWVSYNEHCLRDLPSDPSRVTRVRYEDLVEEPRRTFESLAAWADLDPEPLMRFQEKLPTVNSSTMPDPDKWRRYERELRSARSQVAPVAERLGYDFFPE
jgi:hypothetical protein